MEYKISRKYKMPTQFEMLELGVEGLESREEIVEELKHFDEIAKDYIKKQIEEKNKQEEVSEPFPDRVGPKPMGLPKVNETIPTIEQ